MGTDVEIIKFLDDHTFLFLSLSLSLSLVITVSFYILISNSKWRKENKKAD
jgi:hypothetical protein